MNLDLMPWQVHAINGALTCDDAGDPYSLVFRESLTTTARQQGKSVALVALIGWWMTDYAEMRGEPQSVLSVANKLDRAEAIFAQLAHVLVEQFGGKQMAAVGRKSVAVGKSEWLIRAATKNLHGGSHDLIVVDELWDIDPAVIDEALRPSQIARRSPLLWMASTAGDESSLTMIQLREQALANIDAGERGQLYFAEWSMPPGVDYRDEQYWRWANPALGTTITLQALRSVSKKDSFLRAHLNLWVSARGAWITPAEWDSHITTEDFPVGVASVLAVDSSVDDARYVGIHAAVVNGLVMVKVAFVVQTENEMWEHIERIMADQKVQLAITPTLEIHLPMNLQRRYQTVGYAELLRYSSLVRSMIFEGKVRHNGEKMLAEHVCRAVITKTSQGVVLSSQKSPGPIELCRCMAWAVALVSKPKVATKPMLVITG
jgi:phage terminase large subunit-like protein